MTAPTQSILYEINTRVWLHELSLTLGREITLGGVPDSELEGWVRAGFTHVWLMGIWSTGPKTLAAARGNAQLRSECASLGLDPDEDIGASPYAIMAYRVPSELGGEEELTRLHRRMQGAGLKLILDFVPNHVGIDHPWLLRHPEFFVKGAPGREGSFAIETPNGERWFAHGRDPYFPPWRDTAQLDYRNPQLRAAVIREMHKIATLCDGVRCDMAMLVMNEVIGRTWDRGGVHPAADASEFWPAAIQSIKSSHPKFLFIAEVYWDLEEKLQSQGFDFTYDKRFLDHLVNGETAKVTEHIRNRAPESLARSLRFLENHDEGRAAAVWPEPQNLASAALMLTLPGMSLVHQGQMDGRQKRVPVQCLRWPLEQVNPVLHSGYGELFGALKNSRVGKGEFCVLQPVGVGEGPVEGLVVIAWRDGTSWEIVAANFSNQARRFVVPSVWEGQPSARVFARLPFSDFYVNERAQMLELSLPSYGFAWLAME